MTYRVQGWFDGETECEPAEPDKRWLAIVDEDGNEVCVFVQRKRHSYLDGEPVGRPDYVEEDAEYRESMAALICELLNRDIADLRVAA